MLRAQRPLARLGDVLRAEAFPAAAWGVDAAAAAPAAAHQQLRAASKKQGGSTQNNKDSNPKFLGVKLFGGQAAQPGAIIVRQRGTEFHPGFGVGMGRDHTLFCLAPGRVTFERDQRRKRTYISVRPPPAAAAAAAPAPAAA